MLRSPGVQFMYWYVEVCATFCCVPCIEIQCCQTWYLAVAPSLASPRRRPAVGLSSRYSTIVVLAAFSVSSRGGGTTVSRQGYRRCLFQPPRRGCLGESDPARPRRKADASLLLPFHLHYNYFWTASLDLLGDAPSLVKTLTETIVEYRLPPLTIGTMTNLSTKLAQLEAAGRPIQVGIIGAGKFGSSMFSTILLAQLPNSCPISWPLPNTWSLSD